MTKNRVFSELGQESVFVGTPVNNVYKTNDYSIFQFSKFNRNVIVRKELIKQAKEGILSPIIVNENMVVIDGQHRLTAIQEVGGSVEFIVKKGLDEHDIVRMNTVQKPWSLASFIEAFANQGYEEYVKLAHLIQERYSDTTSTIVVATNLMSLASSKKDIQEGSFGFWNYGKSVEFLSWYKNEFRSKTQTPAKSKICISLWILFQIKGIELDRLISKVSQDQDFVERIKTSTLNQNDAMKQLIDKYNFKLSKKSGRMIEYHITSNGNIVIENEKKEWTK